MKKKFTGLVVLAMFMVVALAGQVFAYPSITYTFTSGTVGRSYSDFIRVDNGVSPYTWTKMSGTIPPGLSLSKSGNYLYLRGTPTSAGTYYFTLRVRDYYSNTATKSFTMTIARSTPVINYTFTGGTVGRSYSDYITVSNGTSPYTWTKTSGTIPTGLSMSRSGNYLYLRGTPTRAGTYSFTLRVRDYYGSTATKSFTITIVRSTPVINYTFTGGTVGRSYSDYITVSNGTSPYTWTKTSGTIPTGLSMSRSGNYLYLRGTPTRAGTYSFTLRVRDYYGSTATKSFTMTIARSTPVINYTFTGGTVGRSYSDYITVSNGTSPYTWTKTSGTIPTGLSMSRSGNYLYLRGTPTRAGTYTFTLKVRDNYGSTASKSFTITVIKSTPVINYTFKSGTVGTYYNDFITVSNGTSPYTWTKTSGTIPSGLSMVKSGNYLYLRGTPTRAATYTFTLRVRDNYGTTATKTFSITVRPKLTINYTFKSGAVGTYYNDFITVTNGTSPYTWTKTSGTLPTGLSMFRSGNYLYLRGTTTRAGTFSFTLKVTDSNGNTATKTFSIVVTTRSYTSGTNSLSSNSTAGIGTVILPAPLSVASSDILEAHEGRDEDLVTVKAGEPVTFILGTWSSLDGSELGVSNAAVFIDDVKAEGVTIDKGQFVLPANMVRGDFKVCVKALYNGAETESEELYIISE